MRDRFRSIARVEKTHGRRGEVVTVAVHGLPSLVREGLEVFVVPPPLRGARRHVVKACRGDAGTGCLVALSGVGDLTGAEALVGKTLLARVSDLPADLALHDAERLVGRTVRLLGSGEEGVVAEVLRGPANDVWVVRGEAGELLLPVIDEVVSEVPATGPIPVSALPGIEWEARK